MFINQLLYKHALRNRKRIPNAFPCFMQCRRILLLFNENDWTALQPAVSRLRSEGREITAIAFTPHSKKNQLPPTDYIRVTKKDFSCLSKPKADLLSILSCHYDLLISLFSQPTLCTQWMVLLSNADFKTGETHNITFQETNQLLDFIIQLPEEKASDTQYLLEQILHYLQHITPQV